uniref:Solute carrier family 25 member 47 n=1 Tax=Oncorhynchus kisutch TaxID=8019 RepID=A0A8C7F5Y6_ONCKI
MFNSVQLSNSITFDSITFLQVRIQTQRRFTGVWQCIHTTWKTEGVNGFYRGMSMPVTTVSISSSVVFGVYRNVLQCLHQLRSTSTGLDFLPAKLDFFLSGLSGGVAQVSVMAPADIVKVRMQCQMVHQGLDAQQPKYRGPMHCLLTIAREEGFLGLYKGAGALALRDGPSFATYFTIYHVICEQLSPPENTQPACRSPLLWRWWWRRSRGRPCPPHLQLAHCLVKQRILRVDIQSCSPDLLPACSPLLASAATVQQRQYQPAIQKQYKRSYNNITVDHYHGIIHYTKTI